MNLLLSQTGSDRLNPGDTLRFQIADAHRQPVMSALPWQLAPAKPFHIPELKTDLTRRSAVIEVRGFILWRKTDVQELRFFYRHQTADSLLLAAYVSGETVWLLGTEANYLVQPISDRMPAILVPEDADRWLNPLNPDIEDMRRMVRPFPMEFLSTYRLGS